MDFLPEGIKEKLGSALGFADRRVKGDLARFKELVESRGQETDAEDPAGNVLESRDFFQRGEGVHGVDAVASSGG